MGNWPSLKAWLIKMISGAETRDAIIDSVCPKIREVQVIEVNIHRNETVSTPIRLPEKTMTIETFNDFVLKTMTDVPLKENDERIQLKRDIENLTVDGTDKSVWHVRDRKDNTYCDNLRLGNTRLDAVTLDGVIAVIGEATQIVFARDTISMIELCEIVLCFCTEYPLVEYDKRISLRWRFEALVLDCDRSGLNHRYRERSQEYL